MNAIFVMSASFPYGEAFSSRARNLTKLMCKCGYHVHIIAPKSNLNQMCEELDGYDYSIEHIYDPKNVLTLSGIGTAKPYMEAIFRYLDKNKIDLILSSSMIFVADKLEKLSKKLGIPYIIEQCEWYDYSIFKLGKYNPYYMEHINRIEKKNKNVDGVISISSLFEKHYDNLGVKTIRIPTILDVENTVYRVDTKKNNIYKIVFAGSLGKGKERLEPVFKALYAINKEKIKICFDIYGPTESQVLQNIEGDYELWNNVKKFVTVHGYIPQNEVPKVIYDADFTIFFRPNRKSSNAGFPTKLAESMSVGTPVITNKTGDIGLYLIDKQNGFLLEDDSLKSIEEVLNHIIKMNIHDMVRMREMARKMAEKEFDFSKYIVPMKEFIKEIKS